MMMLFLALLTICVMAHAQLNTALPEHSTLPQKFSYSLNLESANNTIKEPLQNILELEARTDKAKQKITNLTTTKRKTTKTPTISNRKTTKRKTTKTPTTVKRKTTRRKTTKRKTTKTPTTSKRKTTTRKTTKRKTTKTPITTRRKTTKRKTTKTPTISMRKNTINTCKCGMPHTMVNTKRIVGGTKVKSNKFPWLAQLLRGSPFMFFFCGGSLINDRYVLTAAHCVRTLNTELHVRLLQFDRTSRNAGILRKVVRIIVHSQYSPQTDLNDVALLVLESPVNINYDIYPVCLPKVNQDFSGKMGNVAGWGVTKENGMPSDILQEARVPILTNTRCRQTVYGETIADVMLCAGFLQRGGIDACQGDSGGPLTVQDNTTLVLAGVVSFGNGCAEPNTPGVYARVSKYLDWIEKNTSDGRFCTS